MRVTDAPPTRDAIRRRYATTIDEVRCGLIGLAGRADTRAVQWLKGVAGCCRPDRPSSTSTSATGCSPSRSRSLPRPGARATAGTGRTPCVRDLRRTLRRTGASSPYSVLVRVGAAATTAAEPRVRARHRLRQPDRAADGGATSRCCASSSRCCETTTAVHTGARRTPPPRRSGSPLPAMGEFLRTARSSIRRAVRQRLHRPRPRARRER